MRSTPQAPPQGGEKPHYGVCSVLLDCEDEKRGGGPEKGYKIYGKRCFKELICLTSM